MHEQRPFFLNLLAIRLPIGAVTSILHRISGALLALSVPFLLYGLMLSLRSAEDFQALAAWWKGGLGSLMLLVSVWALAHHFFAGVRHLGFDIGWGEDRATSRLTAWLSMGIAVAATALVAFLRCS
jgi:succinate dehydrogenase / fumarate reductase cytochrome b subunit